LAVTVACAGLLLASGIHPFDAVCLALSTVSTGGFMPIDGDLSAYHSTFVEITVAVFMLIGATSIVWHRMIVEGRWNLAAKHQESYWVIGVALCVGALYAVAMSESADAMSISPFDAVRDGLVTGASLVSTTGFEAHTGGLASLPLPIVLFLAIVGGGAISTAGGIKYYRIGGMVTLSLQELRRLVYPHGIRAARFGSVPYSLELMKSIWSNLAISLLVVIVATLLIAITEPNFDGALTAAVAAFSNIGPLYSAGWTGGGDAWPAYASFGDSAKLVMVVTMILGRFEVLVLFGALSLGYWRS
jgi:trk/ktr system potassium uptake protein